MIGVSRQSINKWEKEDELPPSQYLLSLSKVLRSSIDWLLTGKEFQLQNSSIITTDKKHLPHNIKMDDNKAGSIIFGSYEGRFLTTNKRVKTVVIGGKQSERTYYYSTPFILQAIKRGENVIALGLKEHINIIKNIAAKNDYQVVIIDDKINICSGASEKMNNLNIMQSITRKNSTRFIEVLYSEDIIRTNNFFQKAEMLLFKYIIDLALIKNKNKPIKPIDVSNILKMNDTITIVRMIKEYCSHPDKSIIFTLDKAQVEIMIIKIHKKINMLLPVTEQNYNIVCTDAIEQLKRPRTIVILNETECISPIYLKWCLKELMDNILNTSFCIDNKSLLQTKEFYDLLENSQTNVIVTTNTNITTNQFDHIILTNNIEKEVVELLKHKYEDIEQHIEEVNAKKGKAYLLQPANKYGISKGILINQITPKEIM